MKNNLYKQAVKLFAKQKDLIIQRQDDFYCLSETHIVMKVSESAYNHYFNGEKPLIFTRLDNGQSMRHGEIWSPDNLFLFDLFKDTNHDNAAIRLPYSRDITNFDGTVTCRCFLTCKNNSYHETLINSVFDCIFAGFDYVFSSAGDCNSPIFASSDQLFADVIVCPINNRGVSEYNGELLRKLCVA